MWTGLGDERTISHTNQFYNYRYSGISFIDHGVEIIVLLFMFADGNIIAWA